MASPTRPTAAALAALGATVIAVPALGMTGAQSADAAGESTYTVRTGETLSHVAVATGRTVEELADANGLTSRDLVPAGALLAVPDPGSAVSALTVREGDTLTGIAARTGTSVAALAAANGIPAPYRIVVGQDLAVPVAPGATPTTGPIATDDAGQSGGAGPAATLVVRPGDTLSGIAARAGVGLRALLDASALDASTPIRPGQVLTLPTGAAAAATAAATPSGAARTGEAAKPAPIASTFAGRTYAPEVTAAATASRDALLARAVPSRDQVRELVAATAREMGVDPGLAVAVAHQESGFNARSVSPANAVGTMQVIPSSGAWASGMVGRDLDLLDTRDNAVAGVAILRALTSATQDEPTAIAGYYQGLASVRRDGMYPDTQRYVANVQTLAARYR